jgi:hypothetical protein
MDWLKVCMLLGTATLALTGCAEKPQPAAREYKISADGIPKKVDRMDFIDETVSFTLVQNYKINLMNSDDKQFHFLVANIKNKVGDKVESDEKAVLIPITDGSGNYECTKWSYNVKEAAEDNVKQPVCSFELVGFLSASGKATQAK